MTRKFALIAAVMLLLVFINSCDSNIAEPEPPDSEMEVTITQGIWGQVMFWKGDFMPSPDGYSGTITPVKREIYIYEATPFSLVNNLSGGFINQVETNLVAKVISSENGYYQVELPPGIYSVFIKEKSVFYSFGVSNEYISPVTVTQDSTTEVKLDITYEAYY